MSRFGAQNRGGLAARGVGGAQFSQNGGKGKHYAAHVGNHALHAFIILTALAVAGCDDGETMTAGTSNPAGSGGAGTGSAAGGAGGSGAAGSAAGGAGGVGGAGVGGAGVGGAGGGAGGNGAACTWPDGCAPGFYCDAPGCGVGACVMKSNPASASKDKAPVCGCDGITYWNTSLAQVHGAALVGAGTCAAPLTCDGVFPCVQGARCRREVADAASCGSGDGTCWQVPMVCAIDGPMGHACSNGQCATECALIQSGNPFYVDAACP